MANERLPERWLRLAGRNIKMQEQHFFEKLPRLIRIYLFNFLTKQDLKKAKLVNKSFYSIATTVMKNRYYGEVFPPNRGTIPYSIVLKILSFCNKRELQTIQLVNEGFARCVHRALKGKLYKQEALEVSQVFKGSQYYGVPNTPLDRKSPERFKLGISTGKYIKLFKNKNAACAYQKQISVTYQDDFQNSLPYSPTVIVVCIEIKSDMFLRIHREKNRSFLKKNHDTEFFEFLEIPIGNCKLLTFEMDQHSIDFNTLCNQALKKDKIKMCTLL